MKILFVVHAAPWAEFSGTPLITGQYAQRALARGWDVAFLVPDTAANHSRAPDIYGQVKLFYWPVQAEWNVNAFASPPSARTTPPVEIDYAPDIIHIVDWVLMESSVLAALVALNAPIVRQVWNFEDICSVIEPIHRLPAGQPCIAPLDPRDCAECLLDRTNIFIPGEKYNFRSITAKLNEYRDIYIDRQSQSIETRKLVAHDHFAKIYNKVLFPTESFFQYFNSHMKISSDYEIVEHGVSVNNASSIKKPHKGLNFIYAGGNSKRKGWTAIVQAFSRLYEEGFNDLHLRVYGAKAQTQNSALSNYPNVQFCDPYNAESMAHEFSWADIGLIPTQFETYCRIVREYMICGVVPIASRAFGIPDVVEHDYNGILLDEPTGDQIYEAIKNLVSNPQDIERLRAGCAAASITSPEAEFEKICSIYNELCTNHAKNLQISTAG